MARDSLPDALLDGDRAAWEAVFDDASMTRLNERLFAMSKPAITKHLKVLERAGLIARGREAQWRPVRISAGPLKEIAGWLESYRRFWDESYDRLDEYLVEVQSKERKHGPRRK